MAREEANQKLERAYRECMAAPLEQVSRIGQADIVVGIPFYNEADTIAGVVETVRNGLAEYYPDQSAVIVLAGSPVGQEVLKVVEALPWPDSQVRRLAFTFPNPDINGKGWSIRAIMEIARELGADVAIFEADLEMTAKNGRTLGFIGEWVKLLLEPIRTGQADMVFPRFSRHYLEAVAWNTLVYPLITAIYNVRVREPLGGEIAIANQMLPVFLGDQASWHGDVGAYGIDVWLLTKAIVREARIGEASLGVKLHRSSPGKQELIFRQMAKVLFDQIILHQGWWRKQAGSVHLVNMFGHKQEPESGTWREINYQALVNRFRQGYNRFHESLLRRILPEEVYRRLSELAGAGYGEFNFSPELWSRTVYAFLLTYAFSHDLARGDLLNALVALFQGRVAGFERELASFRSYLERLRPDDMESLLDLQAERMVEDQVQAFLAERPAFQARWREESQAIEPFIPKIAYWEFVPGVPLVLPQETISPEGHPVNVAPIYEGLLRRYKAEFDTFVYERLGVPRGATSQEIAQAVRDFLRRTEASLDQFLLPGDLYTVEGTRAVAEAVARLIPHDRVLTLKPEAATWLLRHYPPVNLMTRWDCPDINSLLVGRDPLDVLALAGWSEARDFGERIAEWLRDFARPEHFVLTDLKVLVVAHEDFPSLVEMKETSALDRLAGRVVVSNLRKNTGGEFPKLRYLTVLAKNFVEGERFSQIWQRFARERREFGTKICNSIEGHWGRSPFSAHNIFENGHQRLLVARLRQMAEELELRGVPCHWQEVVANLHLMADSYHLALTMPDGRFIPCSAWTWASYSFKGGKGIPAPLSLHVERDWFSQEFLLAYCQAVGISPATVEEKIVELIGMGAESQDLAEILLGHKESGALLLEQTSVVGEPQAGRLERYRKKPLLEPVPEHPWENKYVLNSAALRLDGRVYILYRAVGDDRISRLGLAMSPDGFNIAERLPEPVLVPASPAESKGCEDPRATVMEGWVYILYTAYDGLVPQIAMARLSVEDFRAYRWDKWERLGLAFPGVTNKDAFLFPEKFGGRYAMYHRVAPSMWLSFAETVKCPWSREGHRIVMGPRSGMMWDGVKIGAGAQPLKTKYGWLLIYHGVDYALSYRLGVLLVDLSDPGKVLYRSPNSVLEPECDFEIGEEGKCWVPNVVFTCGAVSREDKEVLDDADEILVYYGAADSCIGVATARVDALVPEAVRQVLQAEVKG